MSGQTRRSTAGRQSNASRRRTSVSAVLNAALGLFVRHGYGATSVEQIAVEAQLTKGAVYFYFKDKEALLCELIDRSEQELYQPIFSELAEMSGSGEEILNRYLTLVGRAGVDRNRDLLLLPILMSIELSDAQSEARQRISAMYRRAKLRLGEILEQGQVDTSLRADFDNRAYASLIVSLADGILLDLHRGGSEVSGGQVARAAREMIMRSLLMDRADSDQSQ